MKTRLLYLFASLVFFQKKGTATDISFSFANPQIVTVSTNFWYQVDVYASSTTAFKLGTGQLYFNYNTAAFGENVQASAAISVLRPTGSGLAQRHTDSNTPLYGPFVTNDNTTSRVSYAWIQSLSAGCFSGNNVLTNPTWLFRLRLKYLPGQTGQPPNVCFEQSPVFLDLQFTACGPFDPPADPDNPDAADCAGANAGEQIFDDFFDCAAAALPVELADFGGEWEGPNTRLFWATKTEVNNDFFNLERSLDGLHFEKIAEINGAGTTTEPQNYGWLDREIGQLPGEHFYYRLRQVDFDGAENLSQIVVFARDKLGGESGSGGQFSLFPNPTNGQFQLVFNGENEAMGSPTAQLFSADGRLVSHQILSKKATGFDLTDRAAGSYWLSIFGENGLVQQLRVVLVK